MEDLSMFQRPRTVAREDENPETYGRLEQVTKVKDNGKRCLDARWHDQGSRVCIELGVQWNRDDLGYDSEPERTLLRRRREAKRRARQAALEQQQNMAAEHHDDNLNLENSQNRVTLGQYINPTADSCGSTI
ncbi:hypothetical protein PIB30_040201 [Stylosanthes scabra]|uniref:Uncharacterized protein n=1 Tax=Stylosanthes scabra TaxID=79078 RepID=A0ABU6QF27_9FABA|nr:hypothetical protein [Stylosanthes scabra]